MESHTSRSCSFSTQDGQGVWGRFGSHRRATAERRTSVSLPDHCSSFSAWNPAALPQAQPRRAQRCSSQHPAPLHALSRAGRAGPAPAFFVITRELNHFCTLFTHRCTGWRKGKHQPFVHHPPFHPPLPAPSGRSAPTGPRAQLRGRMQREPRPPASHMRCLAAAALPKEPKAPAVPGSPSFPVVVPSPAPPWGDGAVPAA